jgi:hypothetical protein
MYRIDDATAATSLPVPEAAGTEGFFTEGNPATGTPATNVRGSWLNMIQEELCAILAAAGIARSKTSYNQVNAALQKMYAPVIGTVRNLAMTVATASATATVTADEIVVGAALGGQKYVLPAFNKSINLATVGVNAGVGGMDTGTAPASSFVGIYAIFNPTTGTAALLGVSANAVTLPNVYGGANMPAGYTASALLTVVPTNASSQIVPCVVMNRVAAFVNLGGFTTNTTAATPTIVNNLGVPLNAKKCSGFLQLGSTAASAMSMSVSASSAGVGAKTLAQNVAAGASVAAPFENLLLSVGQRLFYTAASSAGTATFLINVFQYEI